MNTKEIEFTPVSGFAMLSILFLCFVLGTAALALSGQMIFVIVLLIPVFLAPGLFILNPNGCMVLTFFGEYKGSIKKNGFFWVNPLFTRKMISLRAHNFESDKIKVNDKVGNPIQIAVIIVWQVMDSYKASFEVDNYETFVKVQTDSAVRLLAGLYPYDNFEADQEVTLRSGHEQVNHSLEENMRNRLQMAGIRVIEARIGHLAYAPEIASAMLRRQQAAAVVAARFKIVEGAVSMVQMAIEQLSSQQIIELDEERKAAMVSNLMVVLCSDKDVNPVVNAGTLHP